jgi:hypothetical protein
MAEVNAPAEVPEAVREELFAGERVLWCGSPELRRFRGEIWGEVAVGIFLGLLTLIVGIAMIAAGIGGGPTAFLILPVLFLFGYHAAEYLRAPWRFRDVVGRARYVVSDRRALMLDGFGYSRRSNLCVLDDPDRSFYARNLPGERVLRRRRDGSGGIVLDRTTRRARRGSYEVEVGFFGVTDVGRVDGLIAQIAGKPKHARAVEEDRL